MNQELVFTPFAVPEDADLTGGDVRTANLRGSDLTRATLTGADLRGAILDGALLEGATLMHANLNDASLLGAKLDSCMVYGASVWGTRLDEAQQQSLVIGAPTTSYPVQVDRIELASLVHHLCSSP